MPTISIPFDFPDVAILGVHQLAPETLCVTVTSTIFGAKCRKCRRWSTQYHGPDRPIELRHLPMVGYRTLIRICPVRYRCSACHRRSTTTQRLPWYTLRGGHTQAYDASLVQQVVNSTVEDVSRREDIGSEAVRGALWRHVTTEVTWEELDPLELLGVDEISLKKAIRTL